MNKYLEYFRNNPENLWFKRKLYGWGWTPVKWQGWAVLGVYILLLFLIFKDTDSELNSFIENITSIFIPFLALTGVMIFICYKKGEKPRWQWGPPKNDLNNKNS